MTLNVIPDLPRCDLVLNLNLDGPLARVAGNLEGLDSVLEGETVSDKRLNIDEPASDKANGLGVVVEVPVLELEVDLAGAALRL